MNRRRSRRTRPSGSVRARVLAVTAAAAMAAGCGSGTTEVTAKPATIEQLAAAIDGCVPKPAPGPLKDYRQASCTTPSGPFVLNTFDTDSGQGAWLEYSKIYGGTYLVGPRWVIVGKRPQLERLREKIGGDIHTKTTKTNKEKPYSGPTG